MLNPITYAEHVVGDFLRYQLTTYPFAAPHLFAQMRALLNLEQSRSTPLLRGPFISLSRAFKAGAPIEALAREGILHPHMARLAQHPSVYGHQEQAIRAVAQKRTTLVSTGTGSGKTECFLYPVISRGLELRDEGAAPGILAVIVYPMNALAEDQLGRLRGLLAGTGVTFGMYVGKTKERASDVAGERLRAGASSADYRATVDRLRREGHPAAVLPAEERASREELRDSPPRILLTNVKQLELLLTRQTDTDLFDGARLEFLVFDEAHTYSGASGAETACLVRRLRAFCNKRPEETVCIATSATIADPERGPEAGRDFAARFFGVDREGVALVGEAYEEDPWAKERTVPQPLPGDPGVQLQTMLDALRDADVDDAPKAALERLKTAFQAVAGKKLDVRRWREHLFEHLAANEVVHAVAEALVTPRAVKDLLPMLEGRVGRRVPEEEIYLWLALGAAARAQGRPLLRPVIHAFVRGVGGAVVTFPDDGSAAGSPPKLWLSREDAATAEARPLLALDVTTCTTCGQHYFVHHVAGFDFPRGGRPGGGAAEGESLVWKSLDEKSGGQRVVLFDATIADDDDDDADDPGRIAPVFVCRYCGALHPAARTVCDGCGTNGPLVSLFAVASDRERPGRLMSCVCCGARGGARLGQYREPARAVRAQNVSDVHVLAQSIVHFAERKRLLIFTDSRQEAAFQAGWMRDHARRFRLRALMAEKLADGPIAVLDLAAHLEKLLDADDDLSRALLTEVWNDDKASRPAEHRAQRRRYLAAQVLREIATGARQRVGLEPWGRLRVDYVGLNVTSQPFFGAWAKRLKVPPEDVFEGVCALLDALRRSRLLFDDEVSLFTRWWRDGDLEIQRGYFPAFPGGPKGLKLRRGASDKPERISQLLSTKGRTMARHAALGWGLDPTALEEFFESLWKLLTEETHVLRPVVLTGFGGNAIPGSSGAMQIDSAKLLLTAHAGRYRCGTCRRSTLRRTPRMACIARGCAGTLAPEDEDQDDYDLMLLARGAEMVRPREHSAQVPAGDREELERLFKGDSTKVNTLVCTPTLELGVDIGALDAVLMRNVPPMPANYKQRVGRAGRRHRMAVNITYARPSSHDRIYFQDPLKMLDGAIESPRFNLRNAPMIAKHVRSTVLTALFGLATGRVGGLDATAKDHLTTALERCLPTFVKSYLFDDAGSVRAVAFDIGPLQAQIALHHALVLREVRRVFEAGWPLEDSALVQEAALAACVDAMGAELAGVIGRLAARLRWALAQMRTLDARRAEQGTLSAEDDAIYKRHDRFVKRLKGQAQKRKAESEGYDDTYTYAVLAAEGFLPGYGLDGGSVVGTFETERYGLRMRSWELRRPAALALREYVPGNLVYANGHRFLPRYFSFAAREDAADPIAFIVDAAAGAVTEAGTASSSSLGATTIPAIPVCDVVLPHQSSITDDEEFRFLLPVSIFGTEQGRHDGGRAYAWGERAVTFRRGLRMRLVNVGTAAATRGAVQTGGGAMPLGYPVCLVCGQSRSPFASQTELDHFASDHRSRCGKDVALVGFYSDVVADSITLQDCADPTEAYSVAETLRRAAAEVLQLDAGDLQLLVLRKPGGLSCDAVLYDPMTGGSGVLELLIERWSDVHAQATDLVERCAGRCATACIECLLDYRNASYHPSLDRHRAADALRSRGAHVTATHDLPPILPVATPEAEPTNAPEVRLRYLIERAGFVGGKPQYTVDLGRPLGATVPDFYFDDPTGRSQGVCVYLDGLSAALHGNAATRARDVELREELRARDYAVIEIAASDLSDRAAMARKFRQLGNLLRGRDAGQAIADDTSWFDAAAAAHASEHPPPPSTRDDWQETRDLLDDEAHKLVLDAVRAGGLPMPDQVDWDLPNASGRASGVRAVLAWTRASRFVVVVPAAVGFEVPGHVVVHTEVAQTVRELRVHLGEAS
jgi:ATP-dependent helicase YprA (DUF1998 family)